ncbi:MAG: dephospho-CoA kinase [Candidatus Methylopumilus sp.]|nr:dephospho-CoA kinase [Candidatus Methylopumilus sp.]
MQVVVLTGGIGSGKSEAAKQFAALGVPVVDVDAIAHQLTAKGQALLGQIQLLFGADFLLADGSLDRAKLAAQVFAHAEQRLKLESLLHPAIYQAALQQLKDNAKNSAAPYQILVIPLYFESTRYQKIADTVLVIDCPEALQIERAMQRNGSTAASVKAIMQAQVDRARRLEGADEVIDNQGNLAALQEKVGLIHKKFIKTCIVNK